MIVSDRYLQLISVSCPTDQFCAAVCSDVSPYRAVGVTFNGT